MNNKLKKRNIYILFCSLILFFSSFYIGTSKKDDKPKIQLKQLPRAADSASLEYEDYVYLAGWADDYISWSFSTSPSKDIEVWALDSSMYAAFVIAGSAVGYLLSDQSSGSGTFNVPKPSSWFVVFFNKQKWGGNTQPTTVSYSASFHGDARTPNITVIKPTSSSTYDKGESYTVEWTIGINSGRNVKIELFKGNSLDSTLMSNTPNVGSARVQIPNSSSDGSDYRIKITSISSADYYGYSEYFTIQPHIQIYLTIISPVEGEVYETGDTIIITWETNCPSNTVLIKLSSTCRTPYYIAHDALNTGNYSWTIPGNRVNTIISCDYYYIEVYPNDCMIPLHPPILFAIESTASDPTIPSYNMLIVIWTIIWITIPIIIFVKKKYNL